MQPIRSKQEHYEEVDPTEQLEHQGLQPFSVYVRVRPLVVEAPTSQSVPIRQKMMIRGQNQQILQIFENSENVNSNDSSSFLFDKVFNHEASNLEIF